VHGEFSLKGPKCLSSLQKGYNERKVKVPRNRPEGPEGERVIALLFLDLDTRRVWVVSTTSRPFYYRERRGTHFTGDWVGLRAGLEAWEKFRPYWDIFTGILFIFPEYLIETSK
jgi:hypothetical protein